MRTLVLTLLLMSICGCTAMMIGGANSGGYEPPQDECAEDDERCRR
ncbi:MAG: hypothetical protein R3288_00785 [Woeseiaceae bacterium]|nr:hypothetical protein [Woeseiaceae bacterium]